MGVTTGTLAEIVFEEVKQRVEERQITLLKRLRQEAGCMDYCLLRSGYDDSRMVSYLEHEQGTETFRCELSDWAKTSIPEDYLWARLVDWIKKLHAREWETASL